MRREIRIWRPPSAIRADVRQLPNSGEEGKNVVPWQQTPFRAVFDQNPW
jgi:hypothetical protein